MDSSMAVESFKIYVSIEFLEHLRLMGYPPPVQVKPLTDVSCDYDCYDSDFEIEFLE